MWIATGNFVGFHIKTGTGKGKTKQQLWLKNMISCHATCDIWVLAKRNGYFNLPSGELTWQWKMAIEIVDFPMKNGWIFPLLCKRSPEGNQEMMLRMGQPQRRP